MQDKLEQNERTVKAAAPAEHKMTAQEAEDKVAEMFASARSKRDKKYDVRRHSEADVSFHNPENEISELYALAGGSKKDSADEESLSADAAELSPEEAEMKVDMIFAEALASETQTKGSSIPAGEVAVLAFFSFFLFLFSMSSGSPGPLSLIAILLPVLFGMGYRVLKKRMSLREAASKCRIHIFITVFFYICVLLSV